PSHGTADAVTDRTVDAADQSLEQPVARQQRRRQRPAEEQRREGDAREVQAEPPPHPRGEGVAVTEFGDGGDDAALTGLERRQPIDLGAGHRYPNRAGRVPSHTSRSSVMGIENWSWTSTESDPSSTTPMRTHGMLRAEHMPVKRDSSVRGTATSTRPVDSENKVTNGSAPSGISTRQPVSPASAASTTA